MVDFSFKGSILKDSGQNPSRLQGGTLTQKRPSKTKNDLKRLFLKAGVRLAGVRLAGVRLSTLRFRVFTFLGRKVLWAHSLCERGSTPPIGAKPCSCTCCAGPRGLTRPLSWGSTLCPAQPWCFSLPGVFGVPATLLRAGAAKTARAGI